MAKVVKVESLPNGGEIRYYDNGYIQEMDKESIRFEKRMEKQMKRLWKPKKFVRLQTGRG